MRHTGAAAHGFGTARASGESKGRDQAVVRDHPHISPPAHGVAWLYSPARHFQGRESHIFTHSLRRQSVSNVPTCLAQSCVPGLSAPRRTLTLQGTLDADAYFALWRALERVAEEWTIDLVELDREVGFADRVREQGMVIYEHPDSHAQGRHGR